MTEMMDLAEFRERGYLQELNRLFLHPLGLALAVTVHDSGEVKLRGVVDAREDPEGFVFVDALPERDKATSVALERSKRLTQRQALPDCSSRTGIQVCDDGRP